MAEKNKKEQKTWFDKIKDAIWNAFNSSVTMQFRDKEGNLLPERKILGDYISRPTVSPTSTPTSTPTPTPTPMPQDFRFDMGKNDYSYTKPLLEHYYEERGNPPAAEYVPTLIEAGNKHGVDPRILALLMMSESSDMKNYPIESYNPVGYRVPGIPNVVESLKAAGFTSIPHMVDRVTSRFGAERNKYPTFYEEPTISNLQEAYNANESERQGYLDKVYSVLDLMR